MKPKHSPFRRILQATRYSKQGLVSAYRSEAAFRQEIALFLVLLPALYFLPLSLEFKVVLFTANTIVLIAEIFNSAIEAIVDMVSPDFNQYAKKAKDMGSAAVFVSLILTCVLWLTAFLSLLAE